ncbi:hypothetical protein SRHO_G00095550 [Serrasalmus rhombeus]
MVLRRIVGTDRWIEADDLSDRECETFKGRESTESSGPLCCCSLKHASSHSEAHKDGGSLSTEQRLLHGDGGGGEVA